MTARRRMKTHPDHGVAIDGERTVILRAIEGGFLREEVDDWLSFLGRDNTNAVEDSALARVEELLGRELTLSDIAALRERLGNDALRKRLGNDALRERLKNRENVSNEMLRRALVRRRGGQP